MAKPEQRHKQPRALQAVQTCSCMGTMLTREACQFINGGNFSLLISQPCGAVLNDHPQVQQHPVEDKR